MNALLTRARVRRRPHAETIAGVVRGVFTGVDAGGAPLVQFAANAKRRPLVAACACALTRAEIGRPVILCFENGDPRHPVIVGLLQPVRVVEATVGKKGNVDAVLDGERLVLTAAEEVILRCGDASIALTRTGQVRIKGNYVLSRARGVNRIRGGSVQIN